MKVANSATQLSCTLYVCWFSEMPMKLCGIRDIRTAHLIFILMGTWAEVCLHLYLEERRLRTLLA